MLKDPATINIMLIGREKRALAERISRLVKGHRLPRQQIAKLCGVADGSIGNMMYGKGNPTLDNITKIAHFFKVPVSDLLAVEPPRSATAQQPLALYAADARINRLISAFHQLATADQEELLSAAETRAAKTAEIVRELTERNSPAAAAFRPAISDADVERRMNLKSESKPG